MFIDIKRFYQPGIRIKLLLPVLIGMFLLILILLFIWQPGHLELEKQEHFESQERILATLSPTLIKQILTQDYASLHSLLENSLRVHEDWKYISLIHSDGTRLFPIFGTEPEVNEDIHSIQFNLKESSETFGKVVLYIDWATKLKEQRKETELFVFISAGLLALVALLSYFWQTHWINNPILRIQEITTEIANGNYDAKMPELDKDELGKLAKSIDLMRHNVKESQVNLISALQEIEGKEARVSSILQTAPDGIITIDDKGRIQSFNPGAEHIFLYTEEEVLGKNITLLMEELHAQNHDHYIHNYNRTGIATIMGIERQLTAVRKNGEIFPIEVNISATSVNGEKIITGVLRDITERSRLDKAKSDFIATVSHELRTPLTAIKGSLALMSSTMRDEISDGAHSMLEIAERNVERLLLLINDILDISKLDADKVNFIYSRISVMGFIKNAIEINQAYAHRFGTQYVLSSTVDGNIVVNIDKDRMLQALSNLMSNAAKFNQNNKDVEISVSAQNKKIVIAVTDYGQGIPSSFRAKIFEKFSQADTGDTRKVGGTGLGLNIAKQIVEHHQGRLYFESEEGMGTTFYIEIPLSN